MKKMLVRTLAGLTCMSFAPAWAVEGSMSCKVTGNVVVVSEEGKFKQGRSMTSGIKQDDELQLTYSITKQLMKLSLERPNGLVVEFLLLGGVPEQLASAYTLKPSGISARDMLGHRVGIFSDYITADNLVGTYFHLSRYHKNYWHGVLIKDGKEHMWAQTSTLNCRHDKDTLDSALTEFGVNIDTKR